MSILKRTMAAGLAIATLVGTIGGFAQSAHADWRGDRWREHDYRAREWRYHHYGAPYYYGRRVYVAPPIVYGPPPPSPGVSLLFNVR